MDEEIWNENEDKGGGISSEVAIDGKIHMERLYQEGFRTGVAKGQEESTQDGFNVGYGEAMIKGSEWGACQGAITTYVALKRKFPDQAFQKRLDDLSQKMHDLAPRETYLTIYNALAEKKIQEFSRSKEHKILPQVVTESVPNPSTVATMQSIIESMKTTHS